MSMHLNLQPNKPLLYGIQYLTQYFYDPGILPGSARRCILGTVYLRSDQGKKPILRKCFSARGLYLSSMRVARSLSLLSNSTLTRQKLRLQPFAGQQSQYTRKRKYCVCAVRLAAMGTSLKAGCGALAFLLSTDVVRAIRSVENVQELAAQVRQTETFSLLTQYCPPVSSCYFKITGS